MATPPVYSVQLYDTLPAASGGFGVGPLLADFDNVKMVGWEKHLNDVGTAFWTINQDDPKLSGLRAYRGIAHVKIVRDSDVIWRGVWGEHDAMGDDVIFYAYGYESFLYSLTTDWNQRWQDKQIDTIVTQLFTYATTTLTYSPLGFANVHTIQAPVTTSGGATPIVLPLYRLYNKRILFSLRELAALGASDTTNTVYFELAYNAQLNDDDLEFNFWKNKSTDRADVVWEYPNGLVRDFSDGNTPVLARNDLPTVGSAPNDILLRKEQTQATGTYGYQSFGRRMEPLYFSWVRDEDELDRVGKLRLARAVRPEPDIRLYLLANSVVPPTATGNGPAGSVTSGFNLGDRVRVRVSRGLTSIDQYMFVSGVQVLWVRGQERVQPWLMDRPGS